MHRALLAESIDAADALLEAQRIPRQLDVNHEPASVMQIQPLACGIGRNQDIDAAVVERVDRRSPVVSRQAAVDASHAPRRRRQGGDDGVERVAVLREDHGRLARDGEQPPQAANLRSRLAAVRQRDQLLERRSFFVDALEPARRQHRIRLEVVRSIDLLPWQ